MNGNRFSSIKKKVFDVIDSDKIEVTRFTKLTKVSGIYMIYINDFNDDNIIPIYIGQTIDFQERYLTHLKEIMSLNRLSKEIYSAYQNELFYHGSYKACKIFKYMVDHNCSLNDFHMTVLEVCDESELVKKEQEYIEQFHSEFFGFNQLESVSTSMKRKNQNLSVNNKGEMRIKELEKISEYLDCGYNRFNFMIIYGLTDNHDFDSVINDLLIGIRARIKSVIKVDDNHNEGIITYFKKLREISVEAAQMYIIPDCDYIDFPLRNFEIDIAYPKIEENECGIYFVISNDNRSPDSRFHYNQYCAEIIKIIAYRNINGCILKTEYYIENESCNNTYYEKYFCDEDFGEKKPFQATTGREFIHLISLSTEAETGVNDYNVRGRQKRKLKDVIKEIRAESSDTDTFKLTSNQSKKVLNACLKRLPYTVKQILHNKQDHSFSLAGTSILLINNDIIKSKGIYKEEGIMIRRVNDFMKGLEEAIKGNYNFVVLTVSRVNSKSIKVIKALRDKDENIKIIVMNSAGIKGQERLSEIPNLILSPLIFDPSVMMELISESCYQDNI